MTSRIHIWVGTALLLAAGVAFAMQEGHKGNTQEDHKGQTQLKFKEYPINEEFRHLVPVGSGGDPILGQAGDYVVKKSDIDRMLAYYPAETQKQLQENPAEMQTLVQRVLQIKIVADVARKEKFDQRPQIKKQLDFVADDFLSREYLAKAVTPEAAVSEADVKEYYTRNKQRLAVPEQVRARHILFKVDPAASEDEKNRARARAQAVLKRLRAGEDFEKLAQTYSDDQSTKANGGDLGYFTTGRMVPDFEMAAFYTDPGEIGDIVETQYGYHIIKVEDHVEARERSFEEMKDFIREKLRQQAVMSKVEAFIRQAAADAGMQVYAERIAQ
jgi:parvulin-like peptidyl-prolyl isomerase